jgi:hypothetical protein
LISFIVDIAVIYGARMYIDPVNVKCKTWIPLQWEKMKLYYYRQRGLRGKARRQEAEVEEAQEEHESVFTERMIESLSSYGMH